MTDMGTMDTWRRIPEAWKVLTVIFSIIVVSVTTGAAIAGFADIPHKVETMQNEIQELRSNQAQFREEMRNLRSGIELGNCLKLAELEGFPWQRCMNGGQP